MTTQELTQLAEYICSQLPANQAGEFADILFDEIEANYSAADVLTISNELAAVGVDVGPICKRKHPA